MRGSSDLGSNAQRMNGTLLDMLSQLIKDHDQHDYG